MDRSDLEKRLRELNFGYRARYIQEAIQYIKYTGGGMRFFDELKTLSTKDARIRLSKIMGVGRKVFEELSLKYFELYYFRIIFFFNIKFYLPSNSKKN